GELLLPVAAVALAHGKTVFFELALQRLDLLIGLAQLLLARRELLLELLGCPLRWSRFAVDAVSVDEPDLEIRGLQRRGGHDQAHGDQDFANSFQGRLLTLSGPPA